MMVVASQKTGWIWTGPASCQDNSRRRRQSEDRGEWSKTVCSATNWLTVTVSQGWSETSPATGGLVLLLLLLLGSYCRACTAPPVLHHQLHFLLGSRVVSVLDSGAEGVGSNRSRDAVG